jgi:hypothetical protein
MANEVERWRASLEKGRQEQKNRLVEEQGQKMQGLELVARVAIALGDVLSARLAEFSPVQVMIISRFEDVPDIRLSADSLGLFEATWMDRNEVPF